MFGQYKAEIDGFTYHAPTDDSICAAGKRLSFRKYDTRADGAWLKIYWATCSDCQHCPLKPTCVPGAKRKQLTRTIYDGPYRRAWQQQQTTCGQRMRRVRQGTVEPVFGNLLPHYGLRRMNVRGLAGAHKTMLLRSVAYNLKKLLNNYHPTRQVSLAMALPRPLLAVNRRAGCRNRGTQAPTRALTQPLTRKRTA